MANKRPLPMLHSDSLTLSPAMNGPEAVVKRSLLAFCQCLLALTAIAWGVCFIAGEVFHRGYPFNTFLFHPYYRFSDLTDFYVKIRNLRLGGKTLGTGFPLVDYPAPASYVYAFFICLFPNPVVALIVFTIGAALTAVLLLRRQLVRPGVDARLINFTLVTTGVCSYPLIFVIDRGNIEVVVWFFVFLGLAFFIGKRFLISALFFAAAVGIKPFPAPFFFLFLVQRRYKEIAAGFVAVCVANLAALKAIGPTITIALQGLRPGFQGYFYNYIVAFRNEEESFDHSLFSCLKQVIGSRPGWHDRIQEVPIAALVKAYMVWTPVAGLILLASGFYFWRKPILNQIFAITLLVLLLPPISADYTLLDLYLPWGVFIIFLVRDVGSGRIDFSLRRCLSVLIPCAIVMTPQSYLTLAHGGFAGQVKALTMVFLFLVAARFDMPSSLFDELPAKPEPGQIPTAEPLISR